MGAWTFPLLALAVLTVALAVRWFASAAPSDVVRLLRGFAAAFAGLASTGLLLAGRWGFALVTLAALVMAVRGLRASKRGADPWESGAAQATGDGVELTTEWLRVRLDRSTGEMYGEVLRGTFEGRGLSSLSADEARALLAELQDDPQSRPVLEAWLERQHPGWREGTRRRAESDQGPMSEELALRILGLEPGADERAVRQAHRKLMANLHPDRGGSDYLAGQINQARDVLLGKR